MESIHIRILIVRLSRSRGEHRPDHATVIALEGSRTFVRHTEREGVLAHSVSLSLHKSARCLRPVLRPRSLAPQETRPQLHMARSWFSEARADFLKGMVLAQLDIRYRVPIRLIDLPAATTFSLASPPPLYLIEPFFHTLLCHMAVAML